MASTHEVLRPVDSMASSECSDVQLEQAHSLQSLHSCPSGPAPDAMSSRVDRACCWSRQPRALKIGAIAAAALVALAVVVVPTIIVVSNDEAATRLRADHVPTPQCTKLQEHGKQLCVNYARASGESKFTAATEWRLADYNSYACAGLEVNCLNVDLASHARGTVCVAKPDGAACAAGRACKHGYCGGPGAPPLHPDGEASRGPPEDGSTSTSSPTDGAGEPSSSADGSDAADGSDGGAVVRDAVPTGIPVAANERWPTARAIVRPRALGPEVPGAFLATSHEWRRLTDYGGANVDGFANIFRMLGPSPVLRIGGASQDAMTELPGKDVWDALVRLRKETNCRYVIGLPLWQRNAVNMSREIMRAAREALGEEGLLGFELGNEPEFWPTGLGGYDGKGKWHSGFDAYVEYFHRAATELNPCSDNKPVLSGPGWGNVNTQDISWFARVLKRGKCYLQESSVHYYPYVNNATITAKELLAQPLQDFALNKFRAYDATSRGWRLGGPRISETNSLYGGGRVGLSDTLVGSFWVADALFAFAQAGAKAFHLHWGMGGEPSGNSQPNTGVQTNFLKEPPYTPYPSVHAPWWGYLFWTVAAAGDYGRRVDTRFVAADVTSRGNCTANIKVWALKSTGRSQELRVALINKDLDKPCNVDLRVGSSYCSPGRLSRLLPGPGGMFSKGGVTWQGQDYVGSGMTGKLRGEPVADRVTPERLEANEGGCRFIVNLPNSTMALLRVKPGTGDQLTR